MPCCLCFFIFPLFFLKNHSIYIVSFNNKSEESSFVTGNNARRLLIAEQSMHACNFHHQQINQSINRYFYRGIIINDGNKTKTIKLEENTNKVIVSLLSKLLNKTNLVYLLFLEPRNAFSIRVELESSTLQLFTIHL